jgi:hypothetical protein
MTKYIRQTIALILTLIIALPLASGQQSVASQITAIPTGARMEVRLNNRDLMRGTRGPSSTTGFTLVDARNGQRQIAFDDVASVKQLKSHTTRNILIVAGIGVAALAITVALILRCGPLGCGHKAF